MTISRFRARYEKGVLTPLTTVDLAEGAEVSVSVETPTNAQPEVPQSPDIPRSLPGEGLGDFIQRLHEMYPDATSDLPHDGSINYKHYLYGHPRKEV